MTVYWVTGQTSIAGEGTAIEAETPSDAVTLYQRMLDAHAVKLLNENITAEEYHGFSLFPPLTKEMADVGDWWGDGKDAFGIPLDKEVK